MPGVPRLTTPPGMPREVLDIIEVIGNHARTEILRRVAHESSTATELGEAMGISRSSIFRHLDELERHGLVVADVEPGQRRGNKTVRWAAVPERIEQLGRQWIEYASDSDSETPDRSACGPGTGPS